MTRPTGEPAAGQVIHVTTVQGTIQRSQTILLDTNGVSTLDSSFDSVGAAHQFSFILPAAGTYPVAIAASASVEITGGAISVSGAAQQGPEATAANDDGETSATSIQTGITTLTNKAWIFDCVGSGQDLGGFTPDPGQLERFDTGPNSSQGAGSTEEKTTAGLETIGWSGATGSNRLTHVLAAFSPAMTVNYRSIGTNSASIYFTGDATISAGSNVVTLAFRWRSG